MRVEKARDGRAVSHLPFMSEEDLGER